MLKVMVCHFLSNSHEVTTALIVVFPIIVVVDISLQLHPDFEETCFEEHLVKEGLQVLGFSY